MSPTPISKESSPRRLGRQKPDLHISGIAGFIFVICLLADILGTQIIANNHPSNQVLSSDAMA